MDANACSANPAVASGGDSQTKPTGPSILLVDDQPARLFTYEAILSNLQVNCVRALSGEEALKHLLHEEFAAIVLDVKMPGMDGFETARYIREHPRLERMPIIFVTGVHVTELDQLKGYEVGAIDYISVPVVPEILRSKIALLVELYNRRRELARLNRELEAARQRLEVERDEAISNRDEALRVKQLQPQAAPTVDVTSRAAALLDLGDQFRALTSPGDLAYAAARLLGETLKVSRCGYGTIDLLAETIAIERDWNAPGSSSLAGVLHFREYGTYIDDLKRGETVVCPDTRADPRTSGNADRLDGLNVRSFVNMPIIETQGVVALLYLSHRTPRLWTEEELSFIRDVAERTRIAVERRRSEQAVAADLRDTQLLRDLAARLVIQGDDQSLLQDVLTAAMAITEADGGTIQMLRESTQELLLAVTHGFNSEFTAHFERVAAGSSTSCGQALLSGERSLVHFDVPESADSDGSLRLHLAEGFQSAQSTPLISRSGFVLGMLSTHWRTKRTLTDRQCRFLDLLARSAADLMQRSRDEQALRSNEQQLRDEAKRKDEFLAVLAHELRNPLASISAAAHLLTKAEQKPDIAAIAREGLQRQVRHMAKLLDDLLDVARVTHGLIDLEFACVDLTAVIVSAMETIRPQIDLKGHECHLSGAEDAVHVHGDAVRLTQIMTNLLDNATKYTPSAGRIEIQLRKESGCALVVVADTGIGISDALMPRIFERFTRAHQTTGTGSGLGIGLSLVKALVDLHGGTIEARSAGEAMGSEFLIRLPLSTRLDEPATQPLDASPQRIDSLRILIADDNSDSATAWSYLLQEQGHLVRTVFDGRSALLEASRFQPDVALLDIGMPYMNGHEVAQAIRASHWGRQIALVAITGWGQEQDRERAIAAGFDHHLTKPVTPEEIELVLRRVRRAPGATR